MKKYYKPLIFLCGFIVGVCLIEMLRLDNNIFMWIAGGVAGSIGVILCNNR